MTTAERARRQRVMMTLRSWMEERDIPRSEVAEHFGITVGHLSTLINANRTASAAQVDEALRYMGQDVPISTGTAAKMRHKKRPRRSKKELLPSWPSTRIRRPLTTDELRFVQEVAESWIKGNKNASQDEFVNVVRALSLGIRG